MAEIDTFWPVTLYLPLDSSALSILSKCSHMERDNTWRGGPSMLGLFLYKKGTPRGKNAFQNNKTSERSRTFSKIFSFIRIF